MSAVPDSNTNHDSTERIIDQFLFNHDHNFLKSKENLCFRRFVPLFVPIGVRIMMYDEGTASYITIGMWHNNQQATNHSAAVNLGFNCQCSLTMSFTSDDMPLNEWYYENMYKWCHETHRNYPYINPKATKISKRGFFVLVTWPWWLPAEWPEVCGSLTVVGAGTMHGFGTEPIRNPTIWLAESQNQVN